MGDYEGGVFEVEVLEGRRRTRWEFRRVWNDVAVVEGFDGWVDKASSELADGRDELADAEAIGYVVDGDNSHCKASTVELSHLSQIIIRCWCSLFIVK